jgi:hypothetical protein
MATFRTWLSAQEKREDQVGWFACYWRDLEGTPRLSSPSSIGDHLRQRGLFEQQAGLAEAYDAVTEAFRAHRAAEAAGIQPQGQASGQDPLPGMEAVTELPPAEPMAMLAQVLANQEQILLRLARIEQWFTPRPQAQWCGDQQAHAAHEWAGGTGWCEGVTGPLEPLDFGRLFAEADLSAAVEEA